MGHVSIRKHSYGSAVARDRARLRRCEPPPPSGRMTALSTRESAIAHARTGTGSPCCGEGRVAFAAWGSQRQHVMPVAQSAPTFRENSGIAQTPADGGGGSHRRSRTERTLALRDVATNTSMPRAPAREAGRGDETLAPCPRPAAQRALERTKPFQRAWWSAYRESMAR